MLFVWDKIVFILNVLVFVFKINILLRDGYFKIGEVIRVFFKSWKVCLYLEDYENLLFFLVSLCKGFVICVNFLMNCL